MNLPTIENQPPRGRATARILLPVTCALLFLVACASQPTAITREPVTLRLVAADSCGHMAEELALAYEAVRPWVTVRVDVFNASVAARALREGEADLSLLSWQAERSDDGELWSTPFARDGIVVIAHLATPITATDAVYLQEVFRGRIQERDGTVLVPVSREEGSGTRAWFHRVVMAGHDATLTAVVMSSSEAVVEYVMASPGSIGYVSTLRIAESDADRVQVVPVDGIFPDREAISDGSYLLARPLYLAATAEPTGELREFAQWVLGPEGQTVTTRSGTWR